MHAPVFSFCTALVPQGVCFLSSLFISIFASPQSSGVPNKWRIVCFDEKLVMFFSITKKTMTHVNLLSSWEHCAPSQANDQWMNSAKALSCTNDCSRQWLNTFSTTLYSTSYVYYGLFGRDRVEHFSDSAPLISISIRVVSKGNFGSKWNAVGCFK